MLYKHRNLTIDVQWVYKTEWENNNNNQYALYDGWIGGRIVYRDMCWLMEDMIPIGPEKTPEDWL